MCSVSTEPDAKWMDGHSGKAGLGLGLLPGRLATGSDPGVSSPHVLMDISHGAGHGGGGESPGSCGSHQCRNHSARSTNGD